MVVENHVQQRTVDFNVAVVIIRQSDFGLAA
jgi:hypothetical protein